jgi:hypothetical protein
MMARTMLNTRVFEARESGVEFQIKFFHRY